MPSASAVDDDAAVRSNVSRVARLPGPLGVFFDLDGVLAEIRSRPEDVEVPARTQALLGALTATCAVVAVVSGRSGDDVAALLPVPGLEIVGSHGAELRWRGRWERTALLRPDEIEAFASELESDPGVRAAGVVLERKRSSVALHARSAPDPVAALEAAHRAALAAGPRAGLEVLRGRQVVELRPAGVDKGRAVAEMVRRGRLHRAVYVGDDLTDLDAFQALDGLRRDAGLAVLALAVVSPEAPAALLAAADLVVEQRQVRIILETLVERAADPAADHPDPGADPGLRPSDPGYTGTP